MVGSPPLADLASFFLRSAIQHHLMASRLCLWHDNPPLLGKPDSPAKL
jgi:hypothetical protein